MVFAQTAAFYTEQCTSPSLFHNLEVSQGSVNQSLKNYGFTSDTIFKILVCMHTKQLAMKQLLFKIAELEIWLCARRQRESCIHCWLSVWTEPGQRLL